jgi:hypothetical protein
MVQPESPDLRHLPDILDLVIRWRRFDPPKRVTVAGKDTRAEEAVEVEVRLSEPFRIRAVGPVLWVGDEPLTIGDSPTERVYRFYSFAPARLRAGAAITLSWNTAGAPQKETKYRYSSPKRE